MTTALIIGAAVLIVLAGVLLAMRRRRANLDPVVAFQRHIDALSPQARRPTVNRVQELDEGRRGADPRSDDDGA